MNGLTRLFLALVVGFALAAMPPVPFWAGFIGGFVATLCLIEAWLGHCDHVEDVCNDLKDEWEDY